MVKVRKLKAAAVVFLGLLISTSALADGSRKFPSTGSGVGGAPNVTRPLNPPSPPRADSAPSGNTNQLKNPSSVDGSPVNPAQRGTKPTTSPPFPNHPSITRDLRTAQNPYQFTNVATINNGTTHVVNRVDVTETVRRADSGNGRLPGDNRVYQNSNNKLPQDQYTEWTHPTQGVQGRGAQRIVRGQRQNSIYYTKDHYETFWRLR